MTRFSVACVSVHVCLSVCDQVQCDMCFITCLPICLSVTRFSVTCVSVHVCLSVCDQVQFETSSEEEGEDKVDVSKVAQEAGVVDLEDLGKVMQLAAVSLL